MTRTRKTLWITWMSTVAIIVVTGWIHDFLTAHSLSFSPLEFTRFLAKVVFISLTLFGLALAIRYLLRKLFWRVGRRLALSYFLIGLLPFLLFAVMVVFIGYMIAGVLSQASYRTERQTFLTRMDQWNLEYALTGKKPRNVPPTMEIYSVTESDEKVPQWMTEGSYSGFARRGGDTLLVSARAYQEEGANRAVVLAQPLDGAWATYLEKKNGMIVSFKSASARVKASEEEEAKPAADHTLHIVPAEGPEIDTNLDDNDFRQFFKRGVRTDGVIWADLSPPGNMTLVGWNDGAPDSTHKIFTLIFNPWSNLVEFYFGSSRYVKTMLTVIGFIAGCLLIVYLPATCLALVLIFSISRAVNRIEKGTRAVERGDFTYRIAMRPHNQLGHMAQSFDRMTESISGLLLKVAEKERLQSEIDIAASIQRNLLPKHGPSFAGVSFSAHFEPTASIGGDYYDVFSLDKERLAVAIGDVSGHGLSTGLVMAMVKAAMTTLVEEGADEASLFRRLNELVFRSTDKRAFMTLGFTIFDLARRTIRHTNAGHLYPYLLRDGCPPRPIESPSLPLGCKHEIASSTVELPLEEGDTLVYLSDGIIEAQDPRGEPLGFEKLESLLTARSSDDPAAIQLAILAAVEAHAAGHPADDDRTVMVIRFDQLPAVPVPIEMEATAPAMV